MGFLNELENFQNNNLDRDAHFAINLLIDKLAIWQIISIFAPWNIYKKNTK